MCVWSPHLLKDVHKLETVQRYFTRRLFHGCSYKYADRLLLLNLDSLESRRLKFDLRMYFKIINNIAINPATFFIFGPVYNVTRRHGCKLRKRVFSSSHLLNCFTNRAVDCWNALPEEVVNARSYSVFSYKITHIDLTKFLKGMLRGLVMPWHSHLTSFRI